MAKLFYGTNDNNHLLGTDNNNIFLGSLGDDTLMGLGGYDVVDYSHLCEAVTMLPAGVMDKGQSGTDQLFGVEEVVGALNYANTINASGVKGSVALEINLATNKLIVKNIPVYGDRHFTIKNFVNVIGTNAADTIVGNAKNNHFLGRGGSDSLDGAAGNDSIYGGNGHDFLLGGAGNDLISGDQGRDTINSGTGNDSVFGGIGHDHILADEGNDFINGEGGNDFIDGGAGNDYFQGSVGQDTLVGGEGYDVVDYSHLGKAVTMIAAGVIKKGRAGKDQLYGVEEVIGAEGKANTINASGLNSTVTIDVDLAHDIVVVKNIPVYGDRRYIVKNFVNVSGTNLDDIITGDASNNKLKGNGGNDLLDGAEGNDTLSGGAGSDTLSGGEGDDLLYGTKGMTIGADQKDYFFGGAGSDTFVLANPSGGFYNEHLWDDSAVIHDFSVDEDKVQLSDDSEYRLTSSNGNSYLDQYTEGHWDNVAVLENVELNQHDLNNHELFHYV